MTKKRANAFNAAMFHAVNLGLLEIDCTIRINFVKGYYKQTKMIASCVPFKNKVISISIDADLSVEAMNCATAHEMVHAKQYIIGELGYAKNGAFTWYGKKVKKGTPYHEMPWEVEAMQKEIIMAHSFIHFAAMV